MKFQISFFSLLIFTVLFSIEGQAQIDSSYWRGWYRTPVDVVSVHQWEEKGWWTAAGILTTGLVVYSLDDEIRASFQSNRNATTDGIAKYVAEPFGSGLYSLGGSAIAYGIGYLTDDYKLQRTSAQAVKAFVLTGGATQIMKQLTHRARPYEMGDPNLWYGPTGISGDFDAFPSGHTSVAFAVASVYAYSYSENPWVGITAYSFATLTGLSRINDDVHWASDVFFGAALGWYVGRTIVKTDESLNLAITPSSAYVSFSLN